MGNSADREAEGGLSIQFFNAAWKVGIRRPSQRLVLLKLADYADANGVAWPSIEDLTVNTGCSRRTVIRSLAALTHDGYIEVQKRKSPKSCKANRYQLQVRKLGIVGHGSSDSTSPQTPFSGDILSRSQVPNAPVSGAKRDTPPAPPYRKNHQEPPVEPPGDPLSGSAISRMCHAAPELNTLAVRSALANVLRAEMGKGTTREELVQILPAKWLRFVAAREGGRFRINGWGPQNFFAGGHWQDEGKWPWRPEFQPERKLRYVDPATLYSGPEYQTGAA